MAQLTITIPDAAVPRIRRAFGRLNPLTNEWADATAAEVLEVIKTTIKSRVLEYELGLDAMQNRETKSKEQW